MEKNKRVSTITNWKIEDMGDYFRLTGSVFGDDRFEEGEPIYTSMLLRIDFEKNIAETKNTIYNLR